MSETIGILVKIREVLPKHILRNLYFTFVYPYLIYCNLLWASNYATNLKRLVTLQKKIVRIITFSPPNTHTSPLFKQLNLLQFSDLHEYLIYIFVYKYKQSMLPAIFDSWFRLSSSVQSYYTRKANLFQLHLYKKDVGKFSLRAQGCKMWNKLPKELRNSSKLS